MQEGLIINLGSVAGLEPMKATPVYAASKWGIRGWSLSCYEVRTSFAMSMWTVFVPVHCEDVLQAFYCAVLPVQVTGWRD